MASNSKLVAKPVKKEVSEAEMTRFISGAPDAGAAVPAAAPARAPAAAPTPASLRSGGRKKPISLTIDDNLLAKLDIKADALGISRAAAFALAVSRFIAAEEREANR